MQIDTLSYIPLFVEFYMEQNTDSLAIGTAFSVQYENSHFLITNWHNVTGKNPDTGESLHSSGLTDPKFMKVWFHTENIGEWKKMEFRLIGETGKKMYHEHPKGSSVDVVAINYIKIPGIKYTSLDLSWANTPLAVYPAKDVSILGFPNGLTAGRKFPIWKKGHIASEPELDYEDKPMFLIDATTRSGMSGSPVVIREIGMAQFESDKMDSGVEYKGGNYCKFLGVYSGRLDSKSEIGRVWKPKVIHEIINNYRENKPSFPQV